MLDIDYIELKIILSEILLLKMIISFARENEEFFKFCEADHFVKPITLVFSFRIIELTFKIAFFFH